MKRWYDNDYYIFISLCLRLLLIHLISYILLYGIYRNTKRIYINNKTIYIFLFSIISTNKQTNCSVKYKGFFFILHPC